MTIRPNFLIAGAPKSGTTAMSNYLRDHSQVFFSDVKEPFYFASDMPTMRQSTRIETEQAYLSLFADADSSHLAVGEGSTLYLYSDKAISEALRFNANMKFVIMLRRPAEIAHAYHMQMRFHEFEPFEDFQAAWEDCLRGPRKKDETTPLCREPRLIQYNQLASVGTQLNRAFSLLAPEQVKVVVFDDFISNTRKSYQSVLEFVGADDDGRDNFPAENSAMKSRFAPLTRVLRSGPVVSVTRQLKKRLRGNVYSVARTLKHSLMFRNAKRGGLENSFDAQLHQYFRSEVELLEELLGRDFSSWKTPKG